jgi:hypothetical protein
MTIRKKGLIILLTILFLGIFLRAYKLGDESFFRDEFFELNSSYGHFKTGEWVAWDFGNEKPFPQSMQNEYSNTRAQLYRWQFNLLYSFHEPTEALTRSLSVFWGAVSIVLIYFFALSLTGNVWIALLAALLFSISGSSILFDRRLRMYSMFLPTYLVFSWLVFKFYESAYRGKIKVFSQVYEKLKVNLAFLIPTALVGLISFELHELTVSIAAAIVLFCAFLLIPYFRRQEYVNKYSLSLAAIFLGYLLVRNFFGDLYASFNKFVRFFRFNEEYFSFYFDDWRWPLIAAAAMAIGAWFLFSKMQKKKETAFLAASVLGPLLFAVFSWAGDENDRYVYFFQPFSVILAAAGAYSICEAIQKRLPKFGMAAVFGLLILFLGLNNFNYLSPENGVYRQRNDIGHYDFHKIFSVFKNNKTSDDVLVTRAYRSFYWKGEKNQVFDIKTMAFEKDNCADIFRKIIEENKSGWVIFPEIDRISICEEGLNYIDGNLTRIKEERIPESVFIYRWNKK